MTIKQFIWGHLELWSGVGISEKTGCLLPGYGISKRRPLKHRWCRHICLTEWAIEIKWQSCHDRELSPLSGNRNHSSSVRVRYQLTFGDGAAWLPRNGQ